MSVQKSTWSCTKLELCMSVENTETQRCTVACVCHIEFNKLYVFTITGQKVGFTTSEHDA